MKRISLYGGNIEIEAFTDPGEKHEYKFSKCSYPGYPHKAGEKIPAIPGVTTALGVINKPALISWAANMTAIELLKKGSVSAIFSFDRIKKNLVGIEDSQSLNKAMEFIQQSDPEFYGAPLAVKISDLNLARSFHTRYKVAAGERGTDAHQMIENLIKDLSPRTTEGFDRLLDSREVRFNPHVNSMRLWCRNNPHWEILASETVIFSVGLFFCGTLDLKLKALRYMEHPHADGNKNDLKPIQIQPDDEMIVDFKTSGGIWPDMRLQVSAYAAADAEEKEITTGKPAKGAHRAILHLQKDGKPAQLYNYGPEDYSPESYGAEDFSAFLSCLGLHKWIRKNGWNAKEK